MDCEAVRVRHIGCHKIYAALLESRHEVQDTGEPVQVSNDQLGTRDLGVADSGAERT